MKHFTEADLKKVDKDIERIEQQLIDASDWEWVHRVLLHEFRYTLWELRWAIISHMELQERVK